MSRYTRPMIAVAQGHETGMGPQGGPVLLHGVSWDQYEALLAALGDGHPSLRLTYLEGTLEIVTTSPEHERLKKLLARLLEIWALETNATLNGYGAATFRKRAKERGLEPDECYVTGELVDVPEIAIEVVHRHGGIDKLEVYAGLGVQEVWFWENDELAVYALAEGTYARVDGSRILDALDLRKLSHFVRTSGEDQTAAVRAYRDALR